jgi:hypothetical protein
MKKYIVAITVPALAIAASMIVVANPKILDHSSAMPTVAPGGAGHVTDGGTGIHSEADAANQQESVAASPPVTQETDASSSLDYDSKVVTSADFLKPYDTVDQLSADSTVVIEGLVKGTSLYLHEVNGEAVPYTLFDVLVTKSLKGGVKNGSIITVVEYGGIITAAQAGLDKKFPNMTASEKSQKILFTFGDDQVKPSQKLLLFLSDQPGFQILSLNRPYYMLVGEYHGKLIHNLAKSYIQALPQGQTSPEEPVVIDDTVTTVE